MTKSRLPVLDSVFLCSHIDYDALQQPFRLNDPLHTVVVTPDASGQLLAPEFVVYVQMTDEEADGTYEFTVEVRSDTNIVIRPAAVEATRVTFFSRYHPVRPLEHVFVIRDLAFPSPGVYHFHVMCGLASMSDRPGATLPAKLRVIRAEVGGGKL